MGVGQTDRRPVLLHEGGSCHQATAPRLLWLAGPASEVASPVPACRCSWVLGAGMGRARSPPSPLLLCLPPRPCPPPVTHRCPGGTALPSALPAGPSASHTSRSSTHTSGSWEEAGTLAGRSDSSANSRVLPSPSLGPGIPPLAVFPCERHE